MPSVPSFNPSNPGGLPVGLDRADGLNGRIGTPTPAGAITYDSPNGKNTIPTIEELPSSPTMERAEQCTVRKVFTGDYTEMLNRWTVYPRGALVSDSGGNFFRILNTNLNHVDGKGDVGQLELVMEALSFDSPPDEFNCYTVDLGLDILKNPRYYYNMMPTDQIPTPWPAYLQADTAIQAAVKSTIMRAVQAYRENPIVAPGSIVNNVSGYYHDLIIANLVDGKGIYALPNPNFNPSVTATNPDASAINSYPSRATTNGDKNPAIYYASFELGVDADPNAKVALALAAAQELLGKIWRGEDSPPIYGLEITWSEYYWRPPYLNLGSYIEDPMSATPALPDYFTCPNVIPDGSTIFDYIGEYNPQYYSQTGALGGGTRISWLRMADNLEFGRTFFKVTRKWRGAPYGSFDADLFNQNRRPIYPGDYRRIGMTGNV